MKNTNNFLGIDTSNYTTSAAMYDGEVIQQSKRLLPVAKGEKGLRQSDAVFSHVKQIEEVMAPLWEQNIIVEAIGVSDRPRSLADSYMPCFMVGVSIAEVLGQALHVPVYRFSHQQGHIAAALFSAERLDLLSQTFLAFHVSGGTTEAVLVNPDENNLPQAKIVAQSLDLKAGQLIDRIGVMLGLDFPCGPKLEQLALLWEDKLSFRPSMKGADSSLSGVQNQCEAMFARQEPKEKIAAYVLEAVRATLEKMALALQKEYQSLPILFSGGVCSNSIIRKSLTEKFGALFAEPVFSADNAAGIAVLAHYQGRKR
ncbi:Kae1-like domain-containing protein [Scatolibacter rhodanostii]|uniref:Kae1-like domain-containing protein n=1 Tax=Scatolibacter rhodanostii TaxID=2014781 RepID=UPI000C07C2A9|nr:peptidase M22 [Scatolibacter rhodanostii]